MTETRRKMIDCRGASPDKNCTLAISGTEDEVLDAAVQHATTKHGYKAGPDLRTQLRGMLKDAVL